MNKKKKKKKNKTHRKQKKIIRNEAKTNKKEKTFLVEKEKKKFRGLIFFQYQALPFDYTPPNFLKLLFTDLGILTPAAVSDELIKLYGH